MESSISVRVALATVLAALVDIAGAEGIAAGVPGAGFRVSQPPPVPSPQAPVASATGAEDVVKALYQRVSFEAGKNVDWDQVKAMFIPEAVIVLRTSRTAMTVFDRDETLVSASILLRTRSRAGHVELIASEIRYFERTLRRSHASPLV